MGPGEFRRGDPQRFTEAFRSFMPAVGGNPGEIDGTEVLDEQGGDLLTSDEAGFTRYLERLAADEAPQLFAVAVEPGNRDDVHIAAYGLDLGEYAEVIAKDDRFRGSLRSPERALRYFAVGEGERARLVWLTTDQAPEAGLAEGSPQGRQP